MPKIAEELQVVGWLVLERRKVRAFNGIAPVFAQKLKETAEATAETRASYASLIGVNDGILLVSA